MKIIYLWLLVITLLLVACASDTQKVNNIDDVMIDKFRENQKPDYNGDWLGGNDKTPYLEFNKEDYERVLRENKKVLLYFYANWCPICKGEQPNTISAFNEISDSELIGFRVNYRDSETDKDEEALAKEFGVAYQHTKVILKDGKLLHKFPDSWAKERYLEELKKI